MNSVSQSESIYTPCASPLKLGAGVAASNDALDDSKEAFQETLRYFELLKRSNPTLFAIISDAAQELSIAAGTQSMASPPESTGNSTVSTLTGPDIMLVPEIFVNGRIMYKCDDCGKLHDRKGRLIACMNSHSGRKPYQCSGTCGQRSCTKAYASEELLNRHCTPNNERIRECSYCNAKVLKQNLSRHKRSCSLASEP